jgi:pyruvate dehydrogenase kinase 2/3/4
MLVARRGIVCARRAAAVRSAVHVFAACAASSASVRHSSTDVLQAEVEALKARCSALERQQHSNQLVTFYASLKRTSIDINTVVAKCRDPNYRQYIFCHRELPIIAAHMIGMIDQFPSGLFAMKRVLAVRQIVLNVFQKLTAQPVPATEKDERAFATLLEQIMEDLEPVVQTMALGVLELRRTLTMHREALHDVAARDDKVASMAELPELQESLDHFYLALVQFKFLSLQLLQTAAKKREESAKGSGREGQIVGIVDTTIDLVDVARAAAHNARLVCDEHYGDSPEIDIDVTDDDGRAYVSHLHDHLNYILVELLKNSLRATVDTHVKRNAMGFITCEDMPRVVVRIATSCSGDTATVVVSDQGGGIARSDMSKIMSYTYTSTPKTALAQVEEGDQQPTLLAGYGYGLPMSRIHARLFGGDLLVQSVEGYGTEAYLFLKKKAVPST